MIQVSIFDDNLIEGDEDFSLFLNNPEGAILGIPNNSIFIIVDDDFLIYLPLIQGQG